VTGLVTAGFKSGRNILNNAFGSAVYFDCVPTEFFITIAPLKISDYLRYLIVFCIGEKKNGKICIKLSTICNKNEQQQDGKNSAEL